MKKMNVEALVAIDIHTHAEKSTRMLPDEAEQEALEARGRYFRYEVKHPTIAQMADYYRARKIGFVVFTVDHEGGLGVKRISNEEVAESAHEHADICIPFASIDPARGKMGVREARRLIKDFGVRGFKFHPIIQGFFPDDHDVYPLYEAIAEAKLPAIFHTGQTG
ncbi:MAG: amidohydrolase family protein, partial [Proteobacteria bacterium]|nr:amidohydrolase family protein [Pseudomonadota bacterium]